MEEGEDKVGPGAGSSRGDGLPLELLDARILSGAEDSPSNHERACSRASGDVACAPGA
jgi:hypothetical protein